MAEKPDDLIMRRRIETIRQQSQDWEWQQRMCVETLQEQHQQEAMLVRLPQILRSPEVARVVSGIIERNRRKPVYTSGLVTRQQPDLRAMQANLDRLKKRGAELTRQAARERAGYR